MTTTLQPPTTEDSRIAVWAQKNAAEHDEHFVAPTDRVVPVLFTPLIALTVAGAVGCALGPVTSFVTAFGYHDGTSPDAPDGAALRGRSVDQLTGGHPGMV
ncbi:hypothetical protein [Streptomyces sp. B5E4]|uniref:hypothetical protein n=1 Tax=Streptomyces sp. B5E4 TaxID=3153568 RepID=UPI00325D0165